MFNILHLTWKPQHFAILDYNLKYNVFTLKMAMSNEDGYHTEASRHVEKQTEDAACWWCGARVADEGEHRVHCIGHGLLQDHCPKKKREREKKVEQIKNGREEEPNLWNKQDVTQTLQRIALYGD